MTRRPSPPAEVEISETLVVALLHDQHPDLAHLPLVPVGGGWDNAIFRLGRSLAVRLPRRAVAAPLIDNEHRWLSGLAPRLPLPIPVAIRTGRPGHGYPWAWGITAWFEGQPASRFLPLDNLDTARALGTFLQALHTPAPDEAPRSLFRGVPLADRRERILEHLSDLTAFVDRERVLSCWEHAAGARSWNGPRLWIHGDLHPGNILIAEGRIAAVIDFGDLTAGDPATDLAAAWMLFTPRARTAFREAAGRRDSPVDDDTWRRAKGWALALNLVWLVQAADDEEVTQQTLSTIEAVLADAGI